MALVYDTCDSGPSSSGCRPERKLQWLIISCMSLSVTLSCGKIFDTDGEDRLFAEKVATAFWLDLLRREQADASKVLFITGSAYTEEVFQIAAEQVGMASSQVSIDHVIVPYKGVPKVKAVSLDAGSQQQDMAYLVNGEDVLKLCGQADAVFCLLPYGNIGQRVIHAELPRPRVYVHYGGPGPSMQDLGVLREGLECGRVMAVLWYPPGYTPKKFLFPDNFEDITRENIGAAIATMFGVVVTADNINSLPEP